MDYTLQVHEAKYIFPLPNGLKELSSDIIREVLRHQPEQINGFIADYLESMLVVRDKAREAGKVICDVFEESYFFDNLLKTKNVTREGANHYATLIQAAWRGYVVRRKISDWLKKRKKFEEEKQRKRSLKIEELLAELGITYWEATRAAGIIQSAYKESRRGHFVEDEFGKVWVGDYVPFGQRIREGDRTLGRYDRWEKEDFGDFFEMDKSGSIKYIWPKVGQLQTVLKEKIPPDVEVVEFFAMRDLQGTEQYSYLIRSKKDTETRGVPIGFIIPILKSDIGEANHELEFLDSEYTYKMGNYTYIFKTDVTRNELENFEDILKSRIKTTIPLNELGEFDCDPNWVVPRILVRTKKEFLQPNDIEVRFVTMPVVVCETGTFLFRAETTEISAKVIRHMLREKCLSLEESFNEAGKMAPYKTQETGRIFPVDTFTEPEFVQKIEIIPESTTGEEESTNLEQYEYIFLPLHHQLIKKFPKSDTAMKVLPLFYLGYYATLKTGTSYFIGGHSIRFQGYHTEYQGSAALTNKVFIMGPKMISPNGKPFNYESFFWDEFGEEAWYQLMHNLYSRDKILAEEIDALDNEEEEEEEENSEETEEEVIRSEKSTVPTETTGGGTRKSYYSGRSDSNRIRRASTISKGSHRTSKTSDDEETSEDTSEETIIEEAKPFKESHQEENINKIEEESETA